RRSSRIGEEWVSRPLFLHACRAPSVSMRKETIMTAVFRNIEELLAAEGRELGVTEWLEMTQERVNLFAEATGDHQWIHVDPERAAKTPFGGCIAHGYLTLSLASLFINQLMRV